MELNLSSLSVLFKIKKIVNKFMNELRVVYNHTVMFYSRLSYHDMYENTYVGSGLSHTIRRV
jgi:hypothetical protein